MRGSNVKQEAKLFYQSIGSKIRERRIVCGLSQKQLGDAIGMTFQQLQKYERGTNQISLFLLIEVARALNAPLTYFINTDKAETTKNESNASVRMRVDLIRNFLQIPQAAARKHIFDLVKTLAEGEP